MLGIVVIFVVLRAIRLIVRMRRGSKPRAATASCPRSRATIGALVAWRGITGGSPRENSIRQPGRTMVTAAALTVGLALVAFVSVLAAGMKATINQRSAAPSRAT